MNLCRKSLTNLPSFPQKCALESGCASFCSPALVPVTAQVKLRSKWGRKHAFSIYEPPAECWMSLREARGKRGNARLPLCDRAWGAEGGFYARLSPPCRPSLAALPGWIKHWTTPTVGCKWTDIPDRWLKRSKILWTNICIAVYAPKHAFDFEHVRLQTRLIKLEGFVFLQGSSLENSYFIGSYPD